MTQDKSHRPPLAISRDAALRMLEIIQQSCEQAEEHAAGGDVAAATATLALAMGILAGRLEPYAKDHA